MPFDLDQLQRRIGYQFRDVNLLLLALSHPTTEREEVDSNRRLEFLGDKVLGVIVAEELYERYPGSNEGVLTKVLARITSNSLLATYAKAINLGDNLRTDVEHTVARTVDSSLADAFEALVGAIKRDGGWDAALSFVLREFAAELSDATELKGIDNPKGDLQEFLASRSRPGPTYRDISRSGRDDAPTFICAAMCGDTELARSTGPSKKQAEANAAKAALAKLRAA